MVSLTVRSLCMVSLVLASWGGMSHASPGSMDSPAPGSFVSGIGFISGWRCDAGTITASLNGGPPQWVPYNQPRADTRKVCGDEDNGFFLQINWNHLGDGRHTIVVYDDGVEFLRNTFTVMTPGVEFLWTDQGGCSVPDFPAPGETGHFAWSQATQHLELVDISGAPPLAETAWQLVAFGEAAAPDSVVGEVDVQFSATTLKGWTGCNQYDARYRVRGDALQLADLRATEAGCPTQSLFNQEQRVLTLWANVERFEVSGDHLTLHSAGGQVLVFQRVGE